jgi:DDE_Tnp_1-associated
MSRSAILEQFSECWEGLDDPRRGNAVVHDFYELLLIGLCAVLCGGQGAVDMALFARAKELFLRSFLKMENGPPSHDPFSRLFRSLDPQQFGASFQRFMEKFSEGCQGVVAIDGKVLRRSFDRASGKSALHMVSAWGCEQRMVLAQIATDAKSNEITAVPKLLEMLARPSPDRPWWRPAATASRRARQRFGPILAGSKRATTGPLWRPSAGSFGSAR